MKVFILGLNKKIEVSLTKWMLVSAGYIYVCMVVRLKADRAEHLIAFKAVV